MASLSRSFFARPTLQVTRDLLGTRLVHFENGVRLSGLIVEAEAYVGETDLANHARVGRTPRTAPMYNAPGQAYVYFTYGMHWMFNVTTEKEGFPSAVLIRAIEPLEGIAIMAERRKGRPQKDWTNGPAKLTQAMGIGPAYNGLDLCAPDSPLFFEPDQSPPLAVTTTPRVGLYTVPEPWKSIPWRFLATPP
jgi:DNA-3-methyladenine glycosylase